MRKPPKLLLLVSAFFLASMMQAAAAAERGQGNGCPWGSPDCNVCVSDVAGAVSDLRKYGDILGFFRGEAPDPSATKHWQGVQRLMGSNSNTLLVSSSNKDKAVLSTVNMASRANDGLRLRSNRLGDADVENTAPPDSDRVTKAKNLNTNYKHASGFQTVGHFAAVGLEKSRNDDDAMVVLLDYSNPAAPVELTQSALPASQFRQSAAGTTSIARLADLHYLLIVGGSDAEILFFFKSTTTDITDTDWDRVATWNKDDDGLQPGSIDHNWGAYQNINIVSQCDGQLFLVNTNNNGLAHYTGRDWIDAFRMELDIALGSVKLQKVAKKHAFCSWREIPDQCSLGAAGGIYIDPAGRLIVYSTEHDNDGPSGSIKMEEFRSRTSPTECVRFDDSWVELYYDKDWGDRSLMIDYSDRSNEHYGNFNDVERFGDETSSARWCMPTGWRYVLFEDDTFRGATRKLNGTSAFEQRRSFPGFNDETSSSRYECFRNGAWTDDVDRCERDMQAALEASIAAVTIPFAPEVAFEANLAAATIPSTANIAFDATVTATVMLFNPRIEFDAAIAAAINLSTL